MEVYLSKVKLSVIFMKILLKLIFFFLLFNFWKVEAHKDYTLFKTFGNVTVAFSTGFNYEEIQKAYVIGSLAEQLSIKLNYKKKICLNFHHSYTKKIEPQAFIYFGKCWLSRKNQIIVKQVALRFEVEKSLKLIEYAILNVHEIKKNQTVVKYNDAYNERNTLSIDTKIIENLNYLPNSKEIKAVLEHKVYRLESKKGEVSYYWHKGEFNIFCKNGKSDEIVVLKLDSIYQFIVIGSAVFVFDTNNTFYYINDYPLSISKKHLIENNQDYWRIYSIVSIGGRKFAINHFGRGTTLIYMDKNDRLIQDLDKALENQ